MIKINLLPPEHRKVDGTPVGRLVVTVAGVLLVAASAGVWGYVHFAKLAQKREERAALEEELANVKQQADRSQALLREVNEYQRRRETIEKIAASRVLWSRKLDQLADIVHNKGDTKRHLVWLHWLRTAPGRLPNSPAQLSFQGLSGGEEFHKESDFNADIKKNEEFFSDFYAIDPPGGDQVPLDDECVPNQAWEFTFSMDLKAPNWREKQ